MSESKNTEIIQPTYNESVLPVGLGKMGSLAGGTAGAVAGPVGVVAGAAVGGVVGMAAGMAINEALGVPKASDQADD